MSTEGEAADQLDDVFRAIADPTRRLILDQLRAEPLNTSGLVAANNTMTRAGVINHIKILEAAQLIRVEQRGRERINHLNAARLQGVYDRWLNPFEQIWSARLGNLTRAAQASAADTDRHKDMEHNKMAEPEIRVVEIVQQQTCAASPATVWDVMTTQIEQWWTKPYLAEESTGLSLYLEPGGTMWDHRSDGGYAVAIVRGFTAGRELILDGEFGIPGALSGRLVIELESRAADSTTVTFTNTAMGAIPDELPDHEAGWAHLIGSLCDLAAN